MASTTFYNSASQCFLGGLNLESSTIQVAMVGGGYTFDAAHTASDVTDEVASRKSLTSKSVVADPNDPSKAVFFCDNIEWLGLSATFSGFIVIASGTFGGISNPLIAYIDAGDTFTIENESLKIVVPLTGWITATV